MKVIDSSLPSAVLAVQALYLVKSSLNDAIGHLNNSYVSLDTSGQLKACSLVESLELQLNRIKEELDFAISFAELRIDFMKKKENELKIKQELHDLIPVLEELIKDPGKSKLLLEKIKDSIDDIPLNLSRLSDSTCRSVLLSVVKKAVS